jgi:DNA-binding transcriptional LysR family regulator
MAVSLDDLTALATFGRIVEQGSLTAAARALGISKSTASARLSSLEQRLHVQLLRRTTRHLSLTDEGRKLYEMCTTLLSTADDALSAMDSATTIPGGLLRVSVPTGFGVFQLAPALGDFSARHPEVTVELLLSDVPVDLVEQRIDIAIRIADRLADATLAVRRLGSERYALCASPAYLARRGTPLRPEDLAGHNCLRRRTTQSWDVALGSRRISVPVSGTLVADDIVLLREAVLEGVGIARLPLPLVASDIAAGRLATVLAEYSLGEASIFAVLVAHKNQPAKIRAFVDFVAEIVARYGATPVSPPRRERPAASDEAATHERRPNG